MSNLITHAEKQKKFENAPGLYYDMDYVNSANGAKNAVLIQTDFKDFPVGRNDKLWLSIISQVLFAGMGDDGKIEITNEIATKYLADLMADVKTLPLHLSKKQRELGVHFCSYFPEQVTAILEHYSKKKESKEDTSRGLTFTEAKLPIKEDGIIHVAIFLSQNPSEYYSLKALKNALEMFMNKKSSKLCKTFQTELCDKVKDVVFANTYNCPRLNVLYSQGEISDILNYYFFEKELEEVLLNYAKALVEEEEILEKGAPFLLLEPKTKVGFLSYHISKAGCKPYIESKLSKRVKHLSLLIEQCLEMFMKTRS